jgi:hypothetical protein
MIIEQTIEIPPSHRLFLDVPPEVPAGITKLTFTPASAVPASTEREYTGGILADNNVLSEELKMKLQNLRGSLGKNAFGGLDGIAYQHKVREEWKN